MRSVLVLAVIATLSQTRSGMAAPRHGRSAFSHPPGWEEPTPEDRAIAAQELADAQDPGRDPNDGQGLDNCGTDDVDGDTWEKDDVEERIANEQAAYRCTEDSVDCNEVRIHRRFYLFFVCCEQFC